MVQVEEDTHQEEEDMDKNEFLKVSENKEFIDKKLYQRRNKMLIKQENRRYSKLINTRRK